MSHDWSRNSHKDKSQKNQQFSDLGYWTFKRGTVNELYCTVFLLLITVVFLSIYGNFNQELKGKYTL